jgi:Ca-activated chloride channel family protein
MPFRSGSWNVKNTAGLVALLIVVAPVAFRAGGVTESATADKATFKSGIDLVALSVTVTNRAEKHVFGLRADDFVVLEDGVRQSVSFFSATSVPLDLAILLDASASMHGKMALARDAAVALAKSLRPGDRASVVEFRDAVRVRQPLTPDIGAVKATLGEIVPGGSTSMYDALYIALKELAGAERDPQIVRRQAIVLLSDGADTASLIGPEDVLDLARREGVAVYAISLRAPAEIRREKLVNGGRLFLDEGDYGLKRIAQDTGGRAFFPQAPDELRPIFGAVAEEFGHQYAIGYVPSNERRDGTWRRVAVQVLSGDARPRTRTGYFASTDSPARERRVN